MRRWTLRSPSTTSFASSTPGQVWVGRPEDAGPVGVAIASVREGVVYVEEMDVLPAHGRRGLGARLLARVCAWAEERGHPGDRPVDADSCPRVGGKWSGKSGDSRSDACLCLRASVECYLARADGVDAAPHDERVQPAEGIDVDPVLHREALGRLLRRPDLGCVFLFESSGSTLGYAVLTFNYDLEYAGRDAFLTDLFVAASSRGRGYGGHMLREIERAAVALEVKALSISWCGPRTPLRSVCMLPPAMSVLLE